MSSRLPVPRRRGLGIVASLLLVIGLALAVPTAATAAPQDPELGKIKPKLAQQLAEKGTATFWVRFTNHPDLAKATSIDDRTARGQYVYDRLTKAARDSQAEVRAMLDDQGAAYASFWATNAIRVEAGSRELAEDLTERPEVEALYATFDYRQEKPRKGTDVHTPQAVEWGVANINANDVWSEFGDRGEDIVVGSIDSGVQYDHPALVDQYRGSNGDGTFTHDYNWFDAGGSCGAAPCDNDGHGTHTMGTMVGDDGATNQIGVAPGAKWITANGCCPSDAALISSGQWMLAPTDLAGDNPDVSKRPDVINNSWGTIEPSNDPFMEDVEEAWAASGIFGSWSNGNNGPSCQTSGSPGSRIINYSVGAYDVNNAIAGFSSRGAGQDGEIKPNLSAPGVNVRSSIPTNGYGSISGTSMASPHLAGTIALLWSAAPTLRGDIAATRALLDGNAVDADNTTCGGTADDNNVFGEGRLDALALLRAAPVGDTGTLSGTVTDGTDPIGGATVAATGPVARTTTTDDDGSYSLRLPTGEYAVTASAFGYGDATATATITADTTTDRDFALTRSPTVTVQGTVTDGGGHGWPLYAKIAIAGPAPDVWTDPATGEYSVELPSGTTYSFTVTADLPGYLPATEEVVVGASDVTRDVALQVDDGTCTAPGYRFTTVGVTEDFSGGALPDGWTITDQQGNGQVWTFDDPGERGNLTGGDDGFAIVDSDDYGSSGEQDTSLVSPVVDMSGLTAPVVGFAQDYNNLGDTADVDVSVDGGATWQTVLHQTSDIRGPRTDVVKLPMAAGKSAVQVRFHYYDASYAWWWQVDDVFVGNRTCDPFRGGLVVGNVRGSTGSTGVNGATVTSVDHPADRTTTKPTPDDPALDDGFYQLFSSLTGRHTFEASARQYQSQRQTFIVQRDGTVEASFRLAAGHLTAQPTSLATTAKLGGQPKSKQFTLTNDGTAPVNVELGERDGGFVMQSADGSKQDLSDLSKSEGAPLQRLKAPTSLAAAPGSGGGAKAATAAPGTQDAPWTDIADYPSVVMDNAVVNVDGTIYSIAGGDGSASTSAVHAYDPAALAWTPRADLPGARNAVAAGVVDGKVVATGGWADGGPAADTWVYDPSADAWSAAADAPNALSASGQAVLDGKLYTVGGCTTSGCLPMSSAVAAYDPATDTWEELADYPDAVAFASCAGLEGQVFCTGGNDGDAASAATYAYDPSADSWSPVADAPVDLWASASAGAGGQLVVTGGVQGGAITNAAFAYDPGADSWTDLPNSNVARYRGGAACGFYKVGGSQGSFDATADSEMLPGLEDCAAGGADVGWLSVEPTTATLQPGESMTVTVTTDPNVPQPGVYSAAVTIGEDAPGSVDAVSVTMTVTPPAAWGKLAGTVKGTSCAGATAPLPGATVQIDSWAGSWTLVTGSDGGYAQWFNVGANPLQLIAAKDGYAPQTKKVRLTKGGTVRGDFTLKRARC